MYKTEKLILEQITTICLDILQTNLTGIYVHGSIAFDCFQWEKSDIDLIIITNTPPSLQEKEKLLTALLQIDSDCPPKGIEMSIVLEIYCNPFVYPTPFELHFSNLHKQACTVNLKEFCQTMHGVDQDLAAHFTVIRAVGITLYGKPIASVFGLVPKADYVDSIKYDIAEALAEISKNPISVILNLCRVLAYLKSGLVLSKKQGGEWGLKNLPAKYRHLLQEAELSYSSAHPFSQDISNRTLQEFATYMLEQIFMEPI